VCHGKAKLCVPFIGQGGESNERVAVLSFESLRCTDYGS
jgi:hypothetical protein